MWHLITYHHRTYTNTFADASALSRSGAYDCVRVLLEHAPPPQSVDTANTNAPEWTPLHEAVLGMVIGSCFFFYFPFSFCVCVLVC